MKEIKLINPLLVNGVERKVLTYDTREVGIKQIAQAEACKTRLSGSASVSLAQADYLLHICIGMQAVIALNPDISESDLLRLKGYDVAQLAMAGQSFFLPTALSQESNSEKPQEDTQNITIAQ
jgi:hypothetical protein